MTMLSHRLLLTSSLLGLAWTTACSTPTRNFDELLKGSAGAGGVVTGHSGGQHSGGSAAGGTPQGGQNTGGGLTGGTAGAGGLGGATGGTGTGATGTGATGTGGAIVLCEPSETVALCQNGKDDDCDKKTDCADSDCVDVPECVPKTETGKCSDWADNDRDGKTDCNDSDCVDDPKCAPASEAGLCSDGKDNDLDKAVDCADTDCAVDRLCMPKTEINCIDTIDNDGDTKTDCNDQDCAAAANCPVNRETICNDNKDNDVDTKIDCQDSDCVDAANCIPTSETACADGLDNDRDTFVDCKDPDCAGLQLCAPARETGLCGNLKDDDFDNKIDCLDSDCVDDPVCIPKTEIDCGDGIDNDRDGDTDCKDADCAAVQSCIPKTEIDCGNKIDEDKDGYIDCNDIDCRASAKCCTATVESAAQGNLNDGLDNDCNGVVDQPNVFSRFPEFGRASSGDDATVTLTAPKFWDTSYFTECRWGDPDEVGVKPWGNCDTAAPKTLTPHAMPTAAAALATNNGLIEFQFRHRYVSGWVSDYNSIVFYAHNSLWDADPLKSTLLCAPPGGKKDADWLKFASGYLVDDNDNDPATPAPATPPPEFGINDVRTFNPFIRIRFEPTNSYTFSRANWSWDLKTKGAEMLSLRHRFIVDPSNRKLLLITRYYRSKRSQGSCDVGTVQTGTAGTTMSKKALRSTYRAHCQVIVLNRHGAGLCLGLDAKGNVINLESTVKPNSVLNQKAIVKFMKMDWTLADPFLAQKLLTRQSPSWAPPPQATDFFSRKCYVGGPTCVKNKFDLYLPDSDKKLFAP